MSRSPAILLALVATACRDASTVDDPGSTDGSSTGGESSDDELGTDTGGDTEATTTLPVTATDTGTDTGDTGPQPCLTHDVCDDFDQPACGPDGVCVPCDDVRDPDTACASLDAGIDVCNAGTCVQCTPQNTDACTPDAPICDDAFTCTGCSDHAQCPDSACNLFTGACLPAQVVHVDGDGGQDATTIAAGIALLGGDGVLVLHENSGDVPYFESIAVTNASTVAILAASGEAPTWQGTASNPTLSLSNNSTALLAGLSLRNGNGVGLSLSSANAFVQRSRIVQNAGGGISASSGSDLRVENSFVGGDVNDVDAVDVQSSSAAILDSTLGSGFGASSALTCNAAATVDVRNSILVSRSDDPELQCSLATDDGNATEATVGDVQTTWFSDYNGGNFLLTPSGAATFADIATWQTGDPLTDIDGDPRVAIDGQTEHAGADVP